MSLEKRENVKFWVTVLITPAMALFGFIISMKIALTDISAMKTDISNINSKMECVITVQEKVNTCEKRIDKIENKVFK